MEAYGRNNLGCIPLSPQHLIWILLYPGAGVVKSRPRFGKINIMQFMKGWEGSEIRKRLLSTGGPISRIHGRKEILVILREENMKREILPGGLLFMMAAVVLTGSVILTTGCGNTDQAYENRLITVLNPAISAQLVERFPLAPRTDTLEGKTIYLVDMQWGGPQAGYSVFEEMQKWFARNMPSVNVELRRTKNGWMGDDPELRKHIVEKGAAGAVIGIGG